MIKRLLAITALLGVLAGCQSMADASSALAGVGRVTEEKSSFDNSTTVRMAPAWLYREGAGIMGVPVKLAAAWTSAVPDKIILIPTYESSTSGSFYAGNSLYTTFHGIDINIEGEILSFPAIGQTDMDRSGYNTVTHSIYTSSSRPVPVPFEVFQRMMTAKDCRLRIITGNGAVEAHFHIERIPGGQATAIIPLRTFADAVAKNKSA